MPIPVPPQPTSAQDNHELIRARHEAILNAAVDAIVMIDTQGIVQVFNSAASRMFGYQAEEVIGRNVSLLMHGENRTQHDHYIDRYLRTGQARIIGIGRELEAQRKDGSRFPMELAVGEIVEHGVAGFVGLMRDISQRKRIERELRQREAELRDSFEQVGRLGMLGEMTAGIAHEINQPLTAISNYAHATQRLLGAEDFDRDTLTTTLEKIAHQAERAGAVIERVRRFARHREPELTAVNCADLCAEIQELAEVDLRRANLSLKTEIAPELPTMRVDVVQMQQVMLNLIRNAIDASPDRAEHILLSVQRRGEDWLEIHLDDAGEGIQSDMQTQLFEPFTSSKQQGFGLGLSICKSIVDAHGGELRVDRSPLLGGARVSVLLPVNLA